MPVQLPAAVLLNEDIPDSEAIAMPHEVKGLWMARMVPVKAVGSGLPIQFFYYNSKLKICLTSTVRLTRSQCDAWVRACRAILISVYLGLRFMEQSEPFRQSFGRCGRSSRHW